jgi:uncharacterized protein (DUF2141 family)
MKLTILFTFLLGLHFIGYGQGSKLTVEITGFRNNDGKCIVYLYKDKDGFPTDPEKAFRKLITGINDRESRAVFDDLAPGTYAVAVVHDANGNGKTDTNFIGIPKEGLGTSNNPKTMGPPHFDDSKFIFRGEDMIIRIKIKYIL